MPLFEFENLHYDENSNYFLEELNEMEYFKRFFGKLNEKMGEQFSSIEFFIFANDKTEDIPASAKFETLKPKVIFHLADSYGRDPEIYADNFLAVFKTNLKIDHEGRKIFGIPLGVVNGVPELPKKPIIGRKYNVFFRGDLNQNRTGLYLNLLTKGLISPTDYNIKKFIRKVLAFLKSDFSNRFPSSIIKFNFGFKKGYSQQEYGEILAESKIVISPKGFYLAECFRIYESLRAGCVVVAAKLPDTELFRNSAIIQVENWKEGFLKVQELLANPELLNVYQKRSIGDWENRYSEDAVANFVAKKISEII